MYKKLLFTIIVAPLLFACKEPYVAATWKMPGLTQRKYSKLLVVAITVPDTLLRSQLENEVVSSLKQLRYNAVSAMEEYGQKGLTDLAEEATYIKLCNSGVDAVITIALLDKNKDGLAISKSFKYNSNSFYFTRIWNYRKIAANLSDSSLYTQPVKSFFWEGILFDIQTLAPIYVVQTKTFQPVITASSIEEFRKSILNNMLTHKIFVKQVQSLVKPLKTF